MKEFKSFFKTVGGGEGDHCHYPTRCDTYGCGCQHDRSYCVDPNTLILMYDGTQKKISDVKIGDEIYGLKEHGFYKKYVKAVVENKWTVKKPSFKVTLANGDQLICSGNHRWLTEKGWRYTNESETGTKLLNVGNHIMGNKFWNHEAPERTEDYMRGYLSGMIRGDGLLATYDYSHKIGYKLRWKVYQFRLALMEEAGVERTKEFLSYFGVETNYFYFPMVERRTGEIVKHKAIRTNREDNYWKIKELIKPVDSKEFRRGFLAGIYDAEGSKNRNAKRISNCDESLIKEIENALDEFGFSHIRDNDKTEKSGKVLKTVRITGGMAEYLRFRQFTDLAIANNFSIDGQCLRCTSDPDGRKVVSIEPYMEEQELVDITTSTGNFIANGYVSHNCYAKSLLEFRGLWNNEEPSVADVKKIEAKIKKLPKGTILRLGGMTDCFQPCEKTYQVTYRTIRMLNKYRIGYLIVTKSDLVADDAYIKVMDPKLAHIQITVTTLDDEFYIKKQYEKAALPSKRIAAVKKLQDAGFDVAIRLSPLIEEYMDFDKLNGLGINKAVVEFLRVNHWIQKWFDCDFSKHTVKSGGYNHLPLEEKKRILEKVKIPSVTICEDEPEAYDYWTNHFNPNPDDCCNLRVGVE